MGMQGGPPGRADYFAGGDHNVACSMCGRKRKFSMLEKNWQGMYRCPEHNEPRQPQDFVRTIPDRPGVPYTLLEEASFVPITGSLPVTISPSPVVLAVTQNLPILTDGQGGVQLLDETLANNLILDGAAYSSVEAIAQWPPWYVYTGPNGVPPPGMQGIASISWAFQNGGKGVLAIQSPNTQSTTFYTIAGPTGAVSDVAVVTVTSQQGLVGTASVTVSVTAASAANQTWPNLLIGMND